MTSSVPSSRPLSLCRFFAVVSLFLTLTACGGGGDGGGAVPPAWQKAQFLESSSDAADLANVSISAGGDARAIWVQRNGATIRVFSARYTGGQWQPAQSVSDSLPVAEEARVVILESGEAIALWREKEGAARRVMSNITSGGQWGVPAIIEDGQELVQAFDIASDGRGKAIAVWTRGETVFASYFVGGKFEAPEQISVGTTGNASQPAVVMDASGNAVAAWRETSNTNGVATRRVFVRPFIGDAWGSETELSGAFNESASKPTVAIGPAGKAVVAWGQTRGAEQDIVVSVATNAFARQWSPAEVLANGAKPTADVSMDVQGRALVAWEQPANPTPGARINVLARHFDGNTWQGPQLVEVDDAGDAVAVRVKLNAEGQGTAVWSQSDGTRSNMLSNRFNPVTGRWGVPELIENDSSEAAERASLAVNAGGQAVAAWRVGIAGLLGTRILANVFK
jgi:hypothetical protein